MKLLILSDELILLICLSRNASIIRKLSLIGNNYNDCTRYQVKAFANRHRDGVKPHLKFSHPLLKRKLQQSLWRHCLEDTMIGWLVMPVHLSWICYKQKNVLAFKLAKWKIIRYCLINHQMKLEGQLKRPSPTDWAWKARKKSTQFQDKHPDTNTLMLFVLSLTSCLHHHFCLQHIPIVQCIQLPQTTTLTSSPILLIYQINPPITINITVHKPIHSKF